MEDQAIKNLEERLFVDIVDWSRPVTSELSQKLFVRQYFKNEQFLEDLESIIIYSYHQNFVKDSEAKQNIYLSLLKKYPQEVQEGVLDSLRKGKDCCGYIRKEIETFEKELYRKY